MRNFYQLSIIFLLLIAVNGKVYSQTLPPPAPRIKSVSVDPVTNDVRINWHVEINSTPIDYTKVHKLNTPVSPPYANTPVGPNVPFDDSTVVISGTGVNIGPQAFCLTAHPVNTLIPPSAKSDYHFTPFLTISIDSCTAQADIKWTRYKATNENTVEENTNHKPFNESIKYEVWGYQGNPPFDTIPAAKISERTSDTTFKSGTLEKGKNYFFFLRVYLPKGDYLEFGPEFCMSNSSSIIYHGLAIPMYIDITQVEAKDSSIELNFAIDPTSELKEYCIERTTDPSQGFTVIHNFSDKTTTSYIDTDVDTDQRYYYRISALRCGNQVKQSNVAASILLSSEYNPFDALLKWSPSITPGSTYSVTRTIPDNTIAGSGIAGITYNNNILSLIQLGYDWFCYQVTESASKYISISKPSCFIVEPTVYMPDAIDPTNVVVNSTTGAQRNRFGPVVNMVDTMYGYDLVIFNRWGKKVFEVTKKIGEPLSANHLWDGSYKNKLVEPGLYLYTITVNFTNSSTSQKGNVSVFY